MKGKKAIGMKVLIAGLLFVGSFFIGASVQAQDSLEEEYLDALAQAQEAVNRAKNEQERQQAEANVNELEAAIQDLHRLEVVPEAQQRSISFETVRVISVECNGECSENSLGELCSGLIGADFIPFAVDCQSVDDDRPGVPCGVEGDNRCLARPVSPTDPLGNYCDDISGWDAQVYCISVGNLGN